MPVDNTKQPQQILELPAVSSVAELTHLVNDRLQQVNLAFAKFVQNPALGDADLGTSKIVNLADPKDDLDGVNLRTLKKFAGTAQPSDVAKGSGVENPTIYFTFDGLPFDGEESPFAIIMANRDGFTPVAISASAVTAPSSAACQVNLSIAGVAMLAVNLAIPIGSQGPVFTSSLALSAALRKGTLIRGVIAVAGGAGQVTIGLQLRGGG